MGDFVGKEEVERIRAHYKAYTRDSDWQTQDNRAEPVSGIRDASTFREVSTWYVNRLLRYIEVEEMIREVEKNPEGEGAPVILHLKTQRGQPYGSERRCCEQCGIMLWGATFPQWTDDPEVWAHPPDGWRRCTEDTRTG